MKTARTTRSPGGNGNVVTATGLTRRYGAGSAAVDALRGVSLAVSDGELVGIMGPSGSGKSTLLHILAGLDRPTSGEVTIGGQVLSRLGDRDLTVLRRAQVGFAFQFFNLLPMLTCEGNIALPLKLAGTRWDPGWVAYHQTIVMVTHEPKVSTIADRILLLADGQIVDELSHPSTAAVLRAIEGAS